ncbi:MAG: hypothetical protein ABS36_04855 [Acidobacteria bacterium SCN 69-37]|nr:MAG: hypothetical protein ABS36_04855 [Acidobacteria bacterium SCN 69-37]
MHDLFDIVGLSRSAHPVEVRRVCARLVRRAHPDFAYLPDVVAGSPADAWSAGTASPVRRDVAVDFLEMTAVLDRIQSSFFQHPDSRAR